MASAPIPLNKRKNLLSDWPTIDYLTRAHSILNFILFKNNMVNPTCDPSEILEPIQSGMKNSRVVRVCYSRTSPTFSSLLKRVKYRAYSSQGHGSELSLQVLYGSDQIVVSVLFTVIGGIRPTVLTISRHFLGLRSL